MKGTVYFEHKGEFIPAMISEINFTTERGLKRSLFNLIKKRMIGLHLQYGSNQTVNVVCYLKGEEIARTRVTTI